jgi:hypothetical protein
MSKVDFRAESDFLRSAALGRARTTFLGTVIRFGSLSSDLKRVSDLWEGLSKTRLIVSLRKPSPKEGWMSEKQLLPGKFSRADSRPKQKR